jgi:hypothetical protein
MNRKSLKDLFKDTEITLSFGKGWVNFTRPDGMN